MRWSLLLVLAACGRVGFDETTVVPDAALPPIVGELDPSFGNGGIVMPSSGNEGEVWDIALRGTGYLTNGVSYTIAGVARMDVIALAEDGTLDTAYGPGGEVFLQTPSGTFGYAIEMLADGSAVILGDGAFGAEQDNFVLGKLTPTGARDPSWGGGDFVNYNIPTTTSGDTAWSAVTVGATTYFCGIADYNGDPRFTVLATRADGTLETAFATSGILTTNFTTLGDECRDITSDGTGLVAVGRVGDSITIMNIDVSGNVGERLTVMGGTRTAVALAPDGGRIVVAELGTAGFVLRFAGGALDPSFGASGVVPTPRDLFNDVALDAGGRIVAVGKRDNRNPVIHRFLPDGSVDPTFADAGLFTMPIRGEFFAVTIDSRGRIVAVGYDDSGPAARPLVVRLH